MRNGLNAIKAYAVAISLVAGAQTAIAETLPAYNVYNTAPFVVDSGNPKEKGGLAADLVAYLNSKLKGKYAFELQTVPRERLNQEVLNQPKMQGVVLLLNPLFVGDQDKTKFAWTAAIMADKNNVISSTSKKIEYVNPDSLKGLKFAAVRGNKYAGLEERFGKDIQRQDVASELQLLRLVANGRADVALMASTMYRYLMKVNGESEGLEGKLHVSATPHLKFDRFMFVGKESTELAKELNSIAVGMDKDPAWQAVLKKYGLD